MALLFTADDHFDHNNIVVYEARVPYCFEYQAHLWNKKVKPDDDIWVLGDFIWKNHDYWLEKLQGRIHLVRGNHEHRRSKYEKHGVDFWKGPVYLETEELGKVKLTHVPDTTSKLWNLCGHIHGWWRRCNYCINVGVDVWRYQPVSIEQLADYILEDDWLRLDSVVWDKPTI